MSFLSSHVSVEYNVAAITNFFLILPFILFLGQMMNFYLLSALRFNLISFLLLRGSVMLTVSKENMEKLRQALKTLSEAEKQLRVSSNKMTWLTAALLQLVPDQQYMLSRPTADSSLGRRNDSASRVRSRKSDSETRTSQDGSSGGVIIDDKPKVIENDGGQMNKRVEEIWLEVLEKISIKSLKEFMYKEGKLISLSYGAGIVNGD